MVSQAKAEVATSYLGDPTPLAPMVLVAENLSMQELLGLGLQG